MPLGKTLTIRADELRLVHLMRQLEMLFLRHRLDPRDYCLGCNGAQAQTGIERILEDEVAPLRLDDLRSDDGRVIALGRMSVRRLRHTAQF